LGQREQNKQEKRERIINAAIRIIEKGGFDALTMRYLAEEAGVSPRTPYNLFTSKTDILFAIMLQSIDPLGEFDSPNDSELAIAGMLNRLDSLLALGHKKAAFYRSIHWAIMRSDDLEAKSHGREVLNNLIADHIDRAYEQRELKPNCNTESLAVHIGVLLASIIGMWADSQLTLQDAVNHTRQAWINCLLPQARGKALRYLRDSSSEDFLPETFRKPGKVA